MNSPPSHRFGRRAERVALLLLLARGYRLRHRNWEGGGGELDLVMERRGEIVFIEVKARGSDLFGGAAAAVDAHKRRALTRAAGAYLGRFGLWDRPSRFDVIAIERRKGIFPWRLRHYQNAIQPDLGRMF